MSKINKYRKHFEKLKLTDEQGENLVGALECIIESLLSKKFGLSLHESESDENAEGGNLLPRVH